MNLSDVGRLGEGVGAVVSRGGRPDLAGPALGQGGDDGHTGGQAVEPVDEVDAVDHAHDPEGRDEAGQDALELERVVGEDAAEEEGTCIKTGALTDLVQERAGLALSNGADGVIASPQEAALIRALPEAEGKLIVTPGVRPVGATLGDQKRVMTPTQAIANGADHVVVGRPIWQHPNPKAAAEAVVAELRSPQAQAPNA